MPVKLNRNFLNFPLARDTRAKANWFQGSRTGRWLADLPGEGRESHRIRLILPAKAEEEMRRCPSALDMNVLFQLLAEAQRRDATARIEFASLSDLLRRLGLEAREESASVSMSSIEYWSALSIEWQHWYEPGRRHVVRTLPPPVEDGAVMAIASGSGCTPLGTGLRRLRAIICGCPYRFRRRPRPKTLLC